MSRRGPVACRMGLGALAFGSARRLVRMKALSMSSGMESHRWCLLGAAEAKMRYNRLRKLFEKPGSVRKPRRPVLGGGGSMVPKD